MGAAAPACNAVTPLVELVSLAAREGWSIAEPESDGTLEWTRGANRVVAKFTVSTQRPRYCALVNYTDYDGTGEAQLGAVVWRGIGNGGDSDEAAASMRQWFAQPVRALDAPTQW
ncbi:hypothetical protein [Mycolicibacterium iranicum]|uniref:DUF3558 domain-containing protein n=1 Tax=Mycolicibacterium iranicum TaxID=912594 RepID=A0ABT4HM72_MYCIR|nr:hypothetical protein [Mycolicibacterium iranicum]MCZ0730742.1 hypothetical protein [Mycolicibacterium iranicum]